MRSERVPQRGQGRTARTKNWYGKKWRSREGVEVGGQQATAKCGQCSFVWWSQTQGDYAPVEVRLGSCSIKELKAKHVQSHHHNSVKHRKWRWTRCCIMSKMTQQLGGRAGIVECVSPGPQYSTAMPLCSISSHRQEDSGSSGLGDQSLRWGILKSSLWQLRRTHQIWNSWLGVWNCCSDLRMCLIQWRHWH